MGQFFGRQENLADGREVNRLREQVSRLQGDIQTLHSLPYARLRLEKCIDRQKACNDAVNAFTAIHTITVIDSNPVLSLQLEKLKKALTSSKIALSSAVFLCEPPPILLNVLSIIAEKGYTNEVMRCLNLNQATRSCKKLQRVMREVKGRFGLTQLNYFAWKGVKSNVNRMLSMKGIDVETRDNNGKTPLNNAAFYGHVEIVEILLNQRAKLEGKGSKSGTSLFFACQQGHLPVVNLLIKKGAKIESKNDDGFIPLYTASQSGHLPVVNLLISKGANLEATSNRGFRPLHVAAMKGYITIVKALIAKGANINSTTNECRSVLASAKQCKQIAIVSYLLSIGAVDDGAEILPADVELIASVNQ